MLQILKHNNEKDYFKMLAYGAADFQLLGFKQPPNITFFSFFSFKRRTPTESHNSLLADESLGL